MLRSHQQEKLKWTYALCIRCTGILAIKSIDENDIIQLKSSVGSLVKDYKKDHVHAPTAGKNADFNEASSHGKS